MRETSRQGRVPHEGPRQDDTGLGASNWETTHEVVELDRGGFVARFTLLLVVVDVDLDVGNGCC